MAENEAANITHVLLRPPPGTRFSIWGADLRLDFQKGRESEIIAYLHNWIDEYIVPQAQFAAKIAHANAVAQGLIPNTNDEPKVKNSIPKDRLKSLLDNILNNPTIEPNAVNGASEEDHGKAEE